MITARHSQKILGEYHLQEVRYKEKRENTGNSCDHM